MRAFIHTWRHIRRSPFQSLMAGFTLTISFFVITLFIFLNDGLSALLNNFETKPEITIFLKDGLDKAALENIQKELSAYPEIKEVRFISKEKALTIYKDLNKNNPLLTEMVTSSILPASFEISAYNPKVLEVIAQNFAAKTTVVDEIIYQKDVIQSLLVWTNLVRKAGIVSISLLSLIAFFMVFVIIGLKITNRKEEINISRLLGASVFYVKRPFLLEGMFHGIVGSLIGFSLSFGLILYLKPLLNRFFDPVVFVHSDPLYYLFWLSLEILLGLLVGLFASWTVSRRYIKW
jgi:cell division transport system permease protein